MKIYVPNYSQDILNKIKDCLMSIFFKKADLINFFKDCGFYSSDLKNVNEGLTKSTIIDNFFDNIKQNKRITELHNLTRKIIEWRDFDSYWFDSGTLNADTAKKKIESLKNILGEKTNIQEEKEKIIQKREQEKVLTLKKQTRDELKTRFYSLLKIENRQQRGYEFEKILIDIFMYYDIEVYKPFKLEGEQIDGSIKLDGNNYIIEAKWQEKEITNESLYQFAYKIETNTLYPRGIFISISGFSEEAVNRIIHGKSPNLILVDGSDMIAIVEESIGLQDMLIEKVRRAQTKSEIYVTAYEIIKEGLI
jgi:hypothetical protein